MIPPRVLVLGADGFIGRHIAFALRNAGMEVLVSARRPERLQIMGFAAVRADLTDPATHRVEFWRDHLADLAFVVNAAGLLTGSMTEFNGVHVAAPRAVYAAMPPGTRGVLISAVGVDGATRFAKARQAGEAVALAAGTITVLRAGLVLADTSYGGSSLIRALAVLPVQLVVGSGGQPFNPIHAADLADVVIACLTGPSSVALVRAGPWEIGGPETLTQAGLIAMTRRWFGLRPVRQVRLPLGLARLLGRLGDLLRLGPISATAVAQLERGLLVDPTPLLAQINSRPRGVSEFVTQRPAGTQDIWHARLYLLKPLIRLVLAAMWLVSGALGLLLPVTAFLPVLAGVPLPDWLLIGLARGGGMVDLALGVALLGNWKPRLIGLAQLAVVVGYTVGLTGMAPGLWLAPLGEMLKNLPVMVLIAVHIALAEER